MDKKNLALCLSAGCSTTLLLFIFWHLPVSSEVFVYENTSLNVLCSGLKKEFINNAFHVSKFVKDTGRAVFDGGGLGVLNPRRGAMMELFK